MAESLKLPDGASTRYRTLDALGRMLSGELYEDLPFSFETEKDNGEHVPLRKRRPSVDFNLAYEITQDTLAELFGDEQFPTLHVKGITDDKASETADEALADFIEACGLSDITVDVYEEGVVGSVGVTISRSDDGSPFYDVLPGKWCEPIYRSKISNELVMLVVTYPISKEKAEESFPGITNEPENRGAETYWYRYIVGPMQIVEYRPLPDDRFAKLGEDDAKGKRIEFVEHETVEHGFKGRTPAIYVKNLGGKNRDLDGPCLWWPVRNICVEIDYTLSQAGRGLRYCADPMLFVKRGDLFDQDDIAAGYTGPAAGMASNVTSDGSMVMGATQVITGSKDSDAKLLQISAAGIKEEREFVRDLREYALEVLGGTKARAEHLKGAASGTAIDKSLKPLRRLVRRQRRPYGLGMLCNLVELTLYGFACGALDVSTVSDDVDLASIPADAKTTLEWPNDETLQGAELLAHVTGMQLAAGGSAVDPKELIAEEAVGAKLAGDIGFHEPYPAIKGSGMTQAEENPPPAPVAPTARKPKPKPGDDQA